VRSQRVAALARARQEPEELTRHVLLRHGNPYPAEDPRHLPDFDAQEARLRAADVNALRAFHRRFVSAAAGELALVGDFDAAAARAAAEAAFGGWRAPAAGPGVRYARIPQPLYERPPVRLVLATPDKANAAVRFLMPLALNDSHPDAEALEIANHAFGGSLSSRLWMRIRERDGLSYGVGTALQLGPFEPHAVLRGAAIFAPQNQGRVEAALREEFERMAREGLTEAELAEARTGWLNDRRLARAQDEEQARLLGEQGRLGRDWTFEQRRDERVAALTLAQVNAAWRRWVDASRLVFVWGGDFKPVP
jgi:zinc protease